MIKKSLFCILFFITILSSLIINFKKQEIDTGGKLIKVWTPTIISAKPIVLPKSTDISIRVLILRHANEQMAVGDGNLAADAIKTAKNKGLNIELLGNYLVQDLKTLKTYIQQNITKNAIAGDTFIIHTIGHGSTSGLMALGPRKGVMDIFVEEATKAQQETLWWQLSCHASAGLPDINSLMPEQKELFENLPSSTANELSAAGIQGKIMEKVFIALAEKNKSIDPDGDGVITAKELKDFLNKLDSAKRGNLLFAQSPDEPIFGLFGPWMIPILDRNHPQQDYDKNFILLPKR